MSEFVSMGDSTESDPYEWMKYPSVAGNQVLYTNTEQGLEPVVSFSWGIATSKEAPVELAEELSRRIKLLCEEFPGIDIQPDVTDTYL